MIRTITSLILLTHTTLAQFMGSVHPDVSFGDNNNRFDISFMMMRAHSFDTPFVDDDEEDGRRNNNNRRHLQNDDTAALINKLRQTRPKSNTRRADEIDFAYDPDNLPKIGRAGDDNMLDLDYQENLKLFAQSIPKSGRRNDPVDDHEAEVLMQNVVPIVLTVDGFLQTPLKDLISDKAK